MLKQPKKSTGPTIKTKLQISSGEDFRTLLENAGYVVLDGTEGYYRINCPTCGPDDRSKAKRYVHPSRAYCSCFICEELIPVHELLNLENGFQYTGKVEFKKTEHPQAKQLPVKEGTAIPINQLPPNHLAVQFLKKDHINDMDELWEKYQVMYIPPACGVEVRFPSGKFVKPEECLLFPVLYLNELVGWQCRFVNPVGKLKYFHVYNKGQYLYNFDNAREYSKDLVVVFEGVKKAWKHPAGVATLGKNISDKQLQLIQKWEHIILFLDGEDETQEKAKKYQKQMEANSKPFTFILDPRDYGKKSPDEMTHEEVEEAVQSIISL